MDRITTTSQATTTLCVLVVALAAATLIVLLVLHLLPTGVSPVDGAVSDYGVGKYRNFYRLAAFWLGGSGLLLAIALARATFPKPTLTIVMLLIFATARWAITLYPTDLPGAEPTQAGRAHLALAAAAFASIALAAATFHTAVKSDPFWHPHLGLLTALGWAVVVTAVATALTRRVVLRQYFGIVERLLYLAMIGWLVAVALILM